MCWKNNEELEEKVEKINGEKKKKNRQREAVESCICLTPRNSEKMGD